MHALPDTRERVAVVLAEWGLTGEAVEPTLLVVTELLSNAAEHGHGPGWLAIELADGSVHVEVRDDAPSRRTYDDLTPCRFGVGDCNWLTRCRSGAGPTIHRVRSSGPT